jgi:hypothetical protein
MGILEPSIVPYSNRWFTIPKKNGSCDHSRLATGEYGDHQEHGFSPIVDEFAEAFAGRAIYSMGDLYSGYDQFQLAMESRDLTTLGLLRMCTLPQGATNSVAHMMNAMNKVLRDFIPEKTTPFLDNVPIKGCMEEEKDETLDSKGCRKFVADHIVDCDKILSKLEGVHLTLSGVKSMFGMNKILVVGHVWTVWTKAIYGESGCYSKNERVYKYNRRSKVFGGMYVLFYLDFTLCSCGRSIVLLVEKGAKISMDEGAK